MLRVAGALTVQSGHRRCQQNDRNVTEVLIFSYTFCLFPTKLVGGGQWKLTQHTIVRESTTMVSKWGQRSLSATSAMSWVTYALRPSSWILCTTPVVSHSVSTNMMARLWNGCIFCNVCSIGDWLIWDVIVKKNLLPFATSLSTHMLPCMRLTRRFEIDRPRPVPPYSY